MYATKDNATYIENITQQDSGDSDWIKMENTTLNYIPQEITMNSDTTNTTLKTFDTISDNEPIKLIDNNNVIHTQSSGTVTTDILYLTKFWKQNVYTTTGVSNPLGTWTTDSNTLPDTLIYSQAIITKSRVYLLGGYGSNGRVSTVYTAPINSDGTLGAWTTDSNSLPGVLSKSQAIVTKSRVYLLGGLNNNGGVSAIYSSPINTDGTLGAWTTDSNTLPDNIYFSQAIATKSRVYLLGGRNDNGKVSTVYTAPINSDGTLGTWTTDSNSLPDNIYISQAIATKSRVYLLGGINSSSGVTSTIYTAPINTDGTLGAWTTDSNSLPGVLYGSQAIATKSRVYLLGGSDNNNNAVSTIYTAPINDDGTLGSWTTDSNTLPAGVYFSQAIVTKSRVYLLGGWNGSVKVSAIYTAPFSDGWEVINGCGLDIYNIDISPSNLTSPPSKAFYDHKPEVYADISTSTTMNFTQLNWLQETYDGTKFTAKYDTLNKQGRYVQRKIVAKKGTVVKEPFTSDMYKEY